MKLAATCYRVIKPPYAHDPLSGKGAELHGGRFNEKGTAALYLSLDADVAAREAAHGFKGLFPPKMILSYEVEIENVADLTDPAELNRLSIYPPALGCHWESFVSAGMIPSSWLIAKDLILRGYHGILVPSFALNAGPKDKNLVLWSWSAASPHRVTPYDPDNELPVAPPSSSGAP